MTQTETVQHLLRDGFILVFNQDSLDVVKTAGAVADAGFSNMEVTCRIRQPLARLAELRRAMPDLAIGAASLIDNPSVLAAYNAAHTDDPLPSVDQAVDAGADYVVSAANFRPQTYDALAGRVGIIPGCGTVDEIITQFGLGANFVKIFPAKQLGGPTFVKAVDAPTHKTISLVPTGGTNADNIPDYIAAGVLVVGGSFSAIDKPTLAAIIDNQDYPLLTNELKAIKSLIDTARAAQYPDLDFAAARPADISGATGRHFNLHP